MSRFFGKGQRLYKREKLCSVTAIERLFAARPGRNGAINDQWGKIDASLCYPLRMVWGENPARQGAPVRFLVSVPKKRLKKAVDRVRMRRRIREAYRLERTVYYTENATEDTPGVVVARSTNIDVAFIYVAGEIVDSARVRRAMKRLLAALPNHIAEQ